MWPTELRLAMDECIAKWKKEKAMSMSKDRVRFTVTHYMRQSSEFCRLFQDVFRQALPDNRAVPPDMNITIVCRPSQFARFLIERNNRGICNDFKGLAPQLFMQEPIPTTVDVSGNPPCRHKIRYIP